MDNKINLAIKSDNLEQWLNIWFLRDTGPMGSHDTNLFIYWYIVWQKAADVFRACLEPGWLHDTD